MYVLQERKYILKFGELKKILYVCTIIPIYLS